MPDSPLGRRQRDRGPQTPGAEQLLRWLRAQGGSIARLCALPAGGPVQPRRSAQQPTRRAPVQVREVLWDAACIGRVSALALKAWRRTRPPCTRTGNPTGH